MGGRAATRVAGPRMFVATGAVGHRTAAGVIMMMSSTRARQSRDGALGGRRHWRHRRAFVGRQRFSAAASSGPMKQVIVAFAPSRDARVDEPAEHDDGEKGKAEALREATDPFFQRHHHSPVKGGRTSAVDASKAGEPTPPSTKRSSVFMGEAGLIDIETRSMKVSWFVFKS